MERFKPKAEREKKPGRGGARPGAGRPPGSMSRAARLAREEAKKTGELPHVLMAQWAQTGVIRRVKVSVAYEQRLFKNKETGQWEPKDYPIEVPEVDPETGEFVYIYEALRKEDILNTANNSANYFASKLSSNKGDTSAFDAELAERDALNTRAARRLLLTLAERREEAIAQLLLRSGIGDLKLIEGKVDIK